LKTKYYLISLLTKQ